MTARRPLTGPPMSTVRGIRPRLFIIGEPARGDDGAPAAALACVSVAAIGGVEVVRTTALDVEMLIGPGPVVLVDAVRGPQPGTIVEWDLAEVAALAHVPAGSTHGLPLPAVLTLASALGGHPVDGRFVGIAGARFDFGDRLSSSVRHALPAAAQAIEAALAEVLARCV